MAARERLRAGRSVLTTHPATAYPGLRVTRPDAHWGEVSLIAAGQGQTILALGGERVYGYETVDGGRADGFLLGPGDRATVLRTGLPFALYEWEIERACEP